MDMRISLGDVDLTGEPMHMPAPEPFDYAAHLAAHRAHLRAEIRRLRWKVARDIAIACVFLAAAIGVLYFTAAR